MEQKLSVQEVMAVIQKEIDAGKTVRARTYLTHCTNLPSLDRKLIAKGSAPLKEEHITNTDLGAMNKAGCSFGTAALLLIGFGICRLVGLM